MRHLSMRVAWHDRNWDGGVCDSPNQNCYCTCLPRVREGKTDDEYERAGKHWSELADSELPPCVAESAGFMSAEPWVRTFRHPYQSIPVCSATHASLQDTPVEVPPYSTFGVPYYWLLREHKEELVDLTPFELPPDEDDPFANPNPWVFSGRRQRRILDEFFGKVVEGTSLVFFYAKPLQPVDEDAVRLLVGVARVRKVHPCKDYASSSEKSYPIWDRLISHSLGPDGEGFVLPYAEYLESTGDLNEDERRNTLMSEFAVRVPEASIRSFSYGTELVTADEAIPIIAALIKSVRAIRRHGIAEGDWPAQEEWLNAVLAENWSLRGAFPGFGAALEALGMRLGTALARELVETGKVDSLGDPWEFIEPVFRGEQKLGIPGFKNDIDNAKPTWLGMSEERRSLLRILSRFAMNPQQLRRWFEPHKRSDASRVALGDQDIIKNPYLIAENDLGDEKAGPVSLDVLDRGLIPDSRIESGCPIPEPSRVASPHDVRRIRAQVVSILRAAAAEGDTLLSTREVLERLESFPTDRPSSVGSDWFTAHAVELADAARILGKAELGLDSVESVQLVECSEQEDYLRRVFAARAAKAIDSTKADWEQLLRAAIGKCFDEQNPRHVEALQEQAKALEAITTRKLGVLVGRAGTGKTSALSALVAYAPHDVLLLAPTGKARVRLQRATQHEAKTIAQFLNGLDRYDGLRQRPLLNSGSKYMKETLVVIDEASMVTMDEMAAVLKALDAGRLQRLILVGDPFQLPPIGSGRVFADLVAYLDDDKTDKVARAALARLSVEVRSAARGGDSDALRLASWFTGDTQPVDSDSVFGEIEQGTGFGDMSVAFWRTDDELHELLTETLKTELGITDSRSFNLALGMDGKGYALWNEPDGVESFQLLSPVRAHTYGCRELNRWFQYTFRREQLRQGRLPWGTALGDEEIVEGDKVIQTQNKKRTAYTNSNSYEKHYIANGEIGGIAKHPDGGRLNVAFAGRPGLRFAYGGKDFSEAGTAQLELAYALTVHKSQGSEFGTTIVVLPKSSRVLSRELVYTALTRSRKRLVLLLEGDSAEGLYLMSLPRMSETGKRNTRLFGGFVRPSKQDVMFAEHLIHRTDRTDRVEMVRSKSELVIANKLWSMNIDYDYERPLDGRYPDFTMFDAAGEAVIWEHLGMMSVPGYRAGWERKLDWYSRKGFELGRNLFATQDDTNGGLDSQELTRVAEALRRTL